MYKILITDQLGQAGLDLLDQMADVTHEVRTQLTAEELREQLPQFDALIVDSETKIDAEILAQVQKLKVIGRTGISVENIDLHVATRQGIIVMNIPDANSTGTAEHTIALMLATSRHLVQAHTSVQQKQWERNLYVGRQLKEKTLGIIGLGRIGSLVAEYAKTFDMTVIAYDPYVSERVGRDLGIELVDFEDLLTRANYISLHCSATPETENLINTTTLSKMNAGTILINVAHGQLIDEAAVTAALENGTLAGVGIDAYTAEPPITSPLIGHPSVIHTPRLGANTSEALHTVSIDLVEQVVNALQQKDFRHAVNVSFPRDITFTQIRPYIDLAEAIGRIQHNLADGVINKVQLEVTGAALENSIKLLASSVLKGVLNEREAQINMVNAPILAQELGVSISQEYDMSEIDYSNLITCRAYWQNQAGEEASRTVSGVLFGGSEPRIVQVDEYRLEAKPQGHVVVMRNEDKPGVIGQVATLMAAYGVNIGEWRLGREKLGGEALCFINVDKEPPNVVLNALAQANAITEVKLMKL